MVDKKHARATSNLAMLEIVARRLGELNEDVVYLGGCATALYINDPLSLDVRATRDVDCIVDIASLRDYHKFSKELEKKGFKKSMEEDDVVCRWRYEEIILDVMPVDEGVLGFGNRWYKEALACALVFDISDSLKIHFITAPYFLATKFEAFKSRGNNDLLLSHDYEDMVAVVAGRVEIVEEIAQSNNALKTYLKDAFLYITKKDQFRETLPGYLNDGTQAVIMQRVKIVTDRIDSIINI